MILFCINSIGNINPFPRASCDVYSTKNPWLTSENIYPYVKTGIKSHQFTTHRHNGYPIRGPLKTLDTIVPWYSRGFRGCPLFGPYDNRKTSAWEFFFRIDVAWRYGKNKELCLKMSICFKTLVRISV